MSERLQIGWLELDGSVLCVSCGDGWKQTPLYSAPYRQERCSRCGKHMRSVALDRQARERERTSRIAYGEEREPTAADWREEALHDRMVHFSRRQHPDWKPR